MKRYTIKPLVWDRDGSRSWVAKTIFGKAYIIAATPWFILLTPECESFQCATLEAAQIYAEESWYQSKLTQALEEVQ